MKQIKEKHEEGPVFEAVRNMNEKGSKKITTGSMAIH